MGWLRVALCQIDAVVGDFDGNVRRVLDASSRAERLGADVAVFPELVLTGYPPEDLLLEPDFVAASERALAAVAARSAGCAVVVGYVAESGGLRNSAAVCRRGEVRGVAVKELLPNYGVFDEQRWFVPGAGDSPVFRIGGGPVGVVICEDAWAPSGPVARLAAAGAGIVLSLNASPYRGGPVPSAGRSSSRGRASPGARSSTSTSSAARTSSSSTATRRSSPPTAPSLPASRSSGRRSPWLTSPSPTTPVASPGGASSR